MLISYSKQFLFVHIPKTGGASISSTLRPFANDPQAYRLNRLLGRFGVHVNHYGPPRMRKFRRHSSAQVLQRCLPTQTFDEFFKFAFVRNPWDRMVSYYHFVLARPQHHRHRKISRLSGFKDYLRYEIARGKAAQSAMLTDSSGRLLVDYVGRFERLRDDFAEICRRLKISCQLEHHNRSPHSDYRTYYDHESIEIVRLAFHADIALFGYAFEDFDDRLIVRKSA